MEGLLVGRPPKAKNSYSYIVVPKRRMGYDVPDALEVTVLPLRTAEMFQVNEKRRKLYFRKLYVVDFERKDQIRSLATVLPSAIVKKVLKELPASELYKDIDKLKEIDDITVTEINASEIDEEFIRDLYRPLGALSTKRVTATQVIIPIEDKNETILIPLPEVFSYLEENPGIIGNYIFLENYALTLLTTRTSLTYDTFVEEVIENIQSSIRRFYGLIDNMMIGEVEE